VSTRELPWPCPNVIPGMAPLAAILARTEETAVAVTGIRAYPAGFGFTLDLRLRGIVPRDMRLHWPLPDVVSDSMRLLPAEAILRLTVEFADGRSVSNFDRPTIGSGEPDPDRPMMSNAPGTSWGADEWYRDAWCLALEYRVRPLPPPGPLTFVCEWPGRGIPGSRVEADGAAIRRAADAAVTLWLDDPYCSHD
jgi:hypothetical protein